MLLQEELPNTEAALKEYVSLCKRELDRNQKNITRLTHLIEAANERLKVYRKGQALAFPR